MGLNKQLLEEIADNGEEEEEKQKPKKGGGGTPKILADRTYATDLVYTNTTAARLEMLKSAVKAPLQTMSPILKIENA